MKRSELLFFSSLSFTCYKYNLKNKTKKMKKTKTKKQKKITKKKFKKLKKIIGMFAGFLAVIITTVTFYPITISGNDKISPFEFAHFPKTEDEKNLLTINKIRIIGMKECKKRNLDNSLNGYCIKDLIGMAWNESRFNCEAVGDFGASHGCFQIHQGYHKHIKQSQAEDLQFAISWTLDRFVAYDYPKSRSYAIMKHNGTPYTPKTLTYLSNINNYIATLR